ncbi:MAG: uL15m family ribosomal protein [Candidatus Spechtbacterales bacterium]
MQAHELKKTKQKTSRRIGRGGKRGTYSGRGIKGQKSRAGARIRPQIRDYILSTPKLTGTVHKAGGNMGKPREPAHYINTGELDNVAKKGDTVDAKYLTENNLIKHAKGRGYGRIKLLAKGGLSKEITVKGLILSKKAKELVEKAGGKIEN